MLYVANQTSVFIKVIFLKDAENVFKLSIFCMNLYKTKICFARYVIIAVQLCISPLKHYIFNT